MSKTTAREIIAAIMDDLKPWAKHRTRHEIELGVKKRVDQLHSSAANFFDREAKRKNCDSARAIKKSIDKLHSLLSRASPELQMRFALSHRPEIAEWLSFLHHECSQAIERSTKGEGRKNEIQKWCARIAQGLVITYSDSTAKKATNSGSFRHIAELIYGEIGPAARLQKSKGDVLKRACDEVASSARKAVKMVKAADFSNFRLDPVQIAAKKSSEL